MNKVFSLCMGLSLALRRKQLAVVAAPLLAVTVMFPGNVLAAGAQTPTLVQKASMTVDCTTLTTGQLRYAESHGVCGSLGPDGSVTPYNAANGACGQTYIFAYNEGRGDALFVVGGNSTLGPVASYYTNDNWNNWTFSLHGNEGYVGPPNTPTQWWHSFLVYTDSGWVTVSQTGDALLAIGILCFFIPTSDGVQVTF